MVTTNRQSGTKVQFDRNVRGSYPGRLTCVAESCTRRSDQHKPIVESNQEIAQKRINAAEKEGAKNGRCNLLKAKRPVIAGTSSQREIRLVVNVFAPQAIVLSVQIDQSPHARYRRMIR